MTKERIINNKSKSDLSRWVSGGIKPMEIIQRIADVANLKLAWYKVKSNSFMLIPDNQMWQEMLAVENEDWFYDVSNKLLRGQYKYTKATETTILKKNGNYRSLKIVSFSDIIVQKAFFLVLSDIFEKQDYLGACDGQIFKKFSKFNRYEDKASFVAMLYQNFNSRLNFQKKKTINWNDFPSGLTQKKSVHSVIRTIRVSWKLLNYFATCHIDKTFNRVNYSILMKGLEEYIKDKKVCSEIWKMLNSRSISFNLKVTEFNSLGIPNGSVLSPFLFDMYMIKLDRFLELLMEQTNSKSTIKKNNERSLWVKNPLKIKNFFLNRIEYLQLSKKLLKNAKKNKMRSDIVTKMGCKLLYVRHIDDFIIGYSGKKSDVKEPLKRIEMFIKSNLQLNCAGFKLSNACSNYVNYLGFSIKCSKKETVLSKRRSVHAFEKLKNRLRTRKLIENSAYLKILEWSGSKFYRKIIDQTIRDPQQIFIKLGINLKSVLMRWGWRDGLIYLITVLKQKLRLFDFALENVNSSIEEPYYKMAEQFRENQYSKFIQRWSDAAETLAQIVIEDEVKECLPSKIVETLDTARNNFLLQVNKLCKSEINLIQVKNSDLIYVKPVGLPTERADLKVGRNSIKVYANVKNIMEKFKEQGIVNKKWRPICFKKICSQEDYRIISQIATKAYALMYFYSCVDNLWHVKKLVNYTLRYSLAATLARKFKISLKKIFQIYGKDLSVRIKFKGKVVKIASFPSKCIVDSFKYGFNADFISYNRLCQDLQNVSWRTTVLASLRLFKTCGVVNCKITNNVEIYRVNISMFSQGNSIVSFQNKNCTRANFCWKFLESVFRSRTVPLCLEHYIKLNNGFLTLSDLNLDFTIQPTRILKSYSITENV